MTASCASCKHGAEKRPGGERVPAGTVWCSQRSLQMGKNRQMPCHAPIGGGRAVHHCVDCRRAKKVLQTGGVPRPENIWCEKKHMEINRMRNMECFE